MRLTLRLTHVLTCTVEARLKLFFFSRGPLNPFRELYILKPDTKKWGEKKKKDACYDRGAPFFFLILPLTLVA